MGHICAGQVSLCLLHFLCSTELTFDELCFRLQSVAIGRPQSLARIELALPEVDAARDARLWYAPPGLASAVTPRAGYESSVFVHTCKLATIVADILDAL